METEGREKWHNRKLDLPYPDDPLSFVDSGVRLCNSDNNTLKQIFVFHLTLDLNTHSNSRFNL